jgi:hypothetical protein
MIIFSIIQVSIGFALLVALIWNNINYKNKMRKQDEQIDKIMEKFRRTPDV